MSEMTDSQRIHEARGLCVHAMELGGYTGGGGPDPEAIELYVCRYCPIEDTAIIAFDIPDYTDPTSYLEVMAWMQGQSDYDGGLNWYDFINTIGGDIAKILLDPKEGSHALASYLEGREG